MKLSIIAAMSQNHVIGKNNALPWHLPADLKRFKAITLNKPIIMGRKTWDSLGKPLPLRENIVITRNQNLHIEGCHIAHSLQAAISYAHAFNTQNHLDEIIVIGGAEIFAQALREATHLYLTIIEYNFSGDSFFPQFNHAEWKQTFEETHSAIDPNTNQVLFTYRYVNFERKFK